MKARQELQLRKLNRMPSLRRSSSRVKLRSPRLKAGKALTNSRLQKPPKKKAGRHMKVRMLTLPRLLGLNPQRPRDSSFRMITNETKTKSSRYPSKTNFELKHNSKPHFGKCRSSNNKIVRGDFHSSDFTLS